MIAPNGAGRDLEFGVRRSTPCPLPRVRSSWIRRISSLDQARPGQTPSKRQRRGLRESPPIAAPGNEVRGFAGRERNSGSEQNGPCSTERLPETGKHHEVGVERNALKPTRPKWGEAVVVLQAAELALHRGTSPVQVTESLRLSRDRRGAAALRRVPSRNGRNGQGVRRRARPRRVRDARLPPGDPAPRLQGPATRADPGHPKRSDFAVLFERSIRGDDDGVNCASFGGFEQGFFSVAQDATAWRPRCLSFRAQSCSTFSVSAMIFIASV